MTTAVEKMQCCHIDHDNDRIECEEDAVWTNIEVPQSAYRVSELYPGE